MKWSNNKAEKHWSKESAKGEGIRELSLNASIDFSQRESFVLIFRILAIFAVLKREGALTRYTPATKHADSKSKNTRRQAQPASRLEVACIDHSNAKITRRIEAR